LSLGILAWIALEIRTSEELLLAYIFCAFCAMFRCNVYGRTRSQPVVFGYQVRGHWKTSAWLMGRAEGDLDDNVPDMKLLVYTSFEPVAES
jgi:hypothetical protein